MARVIVVGAGVSGLAAAHRLRGLGHDVTVLEATDHVGGKTAAHRRNGFTLNSGATVLGASYTSMLAIARELGIDSQVVAVKPTIGVFADGRIHWLRGAPPGAVIDFIRTPLLSARSKLLMARAAVDALRARRKAGYDQPELRAELDTESVDAYCARRLNSEIRDRLLAPVMGGLFVVDGATVSVAGLFFSLVKFLGGGMLGYEGGIDFFARALADTLDVRLGVQVTSVEKRGDGRPRVRSRSGLSQRVDDVDGVVLSLAAPQVPPVYPGLDPAIQGILLEGLRQANFMSLRLALRHRPAPDALLAVVPFGALGGISTIMFEHNISPGCAPPGKGLLGALLYHEWVTPRMALPDDELVGEIVSDLDRAVPGIAADIEFAQLTRWTPGALAGEPGSHRLIAELDRLIDPRDRVQLAGDFMSIPSIEGSIVTGEAAARRLAGALAG